MLLELLVMGVEVTELVRKDVCVRNEIIILLPVSFLHSDHVEAKSILPGDLVRLREMVNLLIFVQSFIKVAFARGGAPEDIPFMGLCVLEPIHFEHGPDQLIIKSEHFEKKFRVFNVIRFLIS
jgi:hypothetical protein